VEARDAVFISYSHDDQDWRRKFTQTLVPLVRNRRLELWDDTHIPTGNDWRRDIDDAVRRAGVALLLVSGSYLASRFIMEDELPELVAHGVRLVPVLVEDCMWEQEPQLTAVQWAHDPGREGALAAADPREVNGRIVRVCRKLMEFAPAAGPPAPAAQPASDEVPADGVTALAPGRPGPLHEVPALPPEHLERDESAEVRAALLGAGAVGLTGDVPALGLQGQGGIGKTVLAAAVARDPAVREHFPDGVFWVTVGEQPDLVGLQTDLLSRLGVAGVAPRSAVEGAGLLRQALADRQVLLVVDDVWSAAAAEAFRVTGPRGRVLYTTRDPLVLTAVRAVTERVDVLSPPAARQLLARLASVPEGALPEAEVARVLAATGGVALAVALVGAAVRSGASWPQVAGELDRGTDTFLDHPYSNTFKALQAATAALDPDLAFAYRSLAVYPPDTHIPVPAVARYWGQLRGSSPGQVHSDLRALADRQLLILDQDQIAFHDLQHSYLLLQADHLALLHEGLLASYRALLPAADTRWWRLPTGEPYIWEHLLHHLHGAGDRSGVARTLTDLAYLATRIALAGPHAAETDLAEACATHPDDPRIDWLRRWLARHTHVLTGLLEPADVAATLAAWMTDPPAGIDPPELDPLLPSPYLVPRWGLPTETPALDRVLAGHARNVTAVVFSPDGHQLATADADGTVRVWDPATGEHLHTLTGHTSRVTAVAFSPDGHQLATASQDQTVLVWDPATGEHLHTLTGHTGWVNAVAFSPDGHQLATADATVRLWDPATGEHLHTLTGHTRYVPAMAFSPDGHQLATASQDQTARLWDPATGTAQATLTGHTSYVTAVAFSPDGHQLATASQDWTVRLWDPATGEHLHTLTDHTSRVPAVAFSPDGHQLATASYDRTVRLWDPATGEHLHTLTGHASYVTAVAFSPDGHQLATADADGTVRVWDPATSEHLHTLPGHTGWVNVVVFSPDGHQLATASRDRTVRVWDPATGTAQATLTGHTSRVTAAAFSPDGHQLATASYDRTVRLWDPVTGTARATLAGHTDGVNGVAFSPDGHQLATASQDWTVRVWDPATSEHLHTLTGHSSYVTAVAFSPDGHQLATASYDRTVRLWDPATGEHLHTLTGHTSYVTAVAFSPDGHQLATASQDQTVRLWDPATGEHQHTLTGHSSYVTAVAFSPDGHQLATASADGTVQLWDPATGTARAALTGHTATVTAMAFSPDGHQLATASKDQTVRLSDVNAAESMSLLRLDAPIGGLAWRRAAIALGKGTSVVLLDVVAH
jgi:WD40 repeat protein